jgi:hypothetical protein
MSDAGWRLFCHFSEPAHVLAGHLGGIALATIIGAWLARRLVARTRESTTGSFRRNDRNPLPEHSADGSDSADTLH